MPWHRLLAVTAAAALASCGEGASTPSAPSAGDPAPASAGAACGAFAVEGDPRASAGARWTYRSMDAGVTFVLEGLLFAPAGTGPYPAVVLSHGGGGSPAGYGRRLAPVLVGWGLMVIAPEYTHASAPDGDTGLPAGGSGASAANVARAHKARQLLACLGTVDVTRVAAHGHSMGAFVTGEVLGAHPGDFRAASHTAGGVSPQTSAAATHADTAQRIVTPYQLHHGDADDVVALAADRELSRILAGAGARHELRVYAGYDHAAIAHDPGMLESVRAWYASHGLF